MLAENQKNSLVPDITAVRTASAKLIRYPGHEEWTELFDLQADPFETRNIVTERPAMAARLREALAADQRRLLAAWQNSGAEEATTPQNEALRGLGYIQ